MTESRAVRSVVLVAALVAITCVHATADPLPRRTTKRDEARTEIRPPRAALAVNLPLLWYRGGSLSMSGWVGLTDRHAIHVNIARAKYAPITPAARLAVLLGDGYYNEVVYEGYVGDVSATWAFFPMSLWNGPYVELGAHGRRNNYDSDHGFALGQHQETRTTVISGIARLGWSLAFGTFGTRVFISAGVGFGYGYEWGWELNSMSSLGPSPPPPASSGPVSRGTMLSELDLRFGITL
ncbi:MAG: hypothetical protein AB7O24_26905 [Kofleriaceae bacterium]